MRFEIYDKKQKQEFNNFLKEKYGFELKGQIIKQSTDKLRIFTGNLSEHELNVLAGTVRIETVGLYLATIDKNKENHEENIRFSFDASFLGKKATKNVLDLNDEQVKQWFKGNDISLEEQRPDTDQNSTLMYSYIFLKYKDEMVGCGKLVQGKILNFVPKERRIKY